MKLQELKKKADEEVVNVDKEIDSINNYRELFPLGCDLFIPLRLLLAVEMHCDNNNIPFFDVSGDGCISTAKTYTALVYHESMR